ncbi:MAG: hypothetical protein Sapg2KO_04100 [Saprospiraceae bacterium]
MHNQDVQVQSSTGSLVGDGCLELVFVHGNGYRTRFGNRTQMWGEGIYIGGHLDQQLHLDILPKTYLTIVKLEPWAACLISNFDFRKTLNQTIPLQDVNKHLHKKLMLKNTSAFNNSMLHTLYQEMEQNRTQSRDLKLIQHVSQVLENNYQEFKYYKKELLKNIKISSRSLETKFGQSVGLTPLKFSNTIRFRKAIEQIYHFSNEVSLVHLAYQHGYFDQSHFIRTCRSVTGIPPSKISEENCFLTDHRDTFRYYTI